MVKQIVAQFAVTAEIIVKCRTIVRAVILKRCSGLLISGIGYDLYLLAAVIGQRLCFGDVDIQIIGCVCRLYRIVNPVSKDAV